MRVFTSLFVTAFVGVALIACSANVENEPVGETQQAVTATCATKFGCSCTSTNGSCSGNGTATIVCKDSTGSVSCHDYMDHGTQVCDCSGSAKTTSTTAD